MFPRTAVRSRIGASQRHGQRRGLVVTCAVSAFLLTASSYPAPAQLTLSAEPQAKGRTSAAKQPKTLRDAVRPSRRADPAARMLVQANELVYDYQRDQVSAVGQVQIYYDGAVLEADKVTYDRKANRLYAHGNVRYKAKDGNIIYGETVELAADFRDGFIQSLLVETPERTRFAAARAERREGKITVLESGVYTACEPCKEDPKKPPLWQVKAARIIHNEQERIIYYENASLEFFGVPIAWVPYFWHPDPTVKRQSGFLAPNIFSNSRVGVGVEIPYFWALAPNYDFTLSVAPVSRQVGPLVKGEWRHRLMTGAYTIRAAGIFQQDKEAFRQSRGPSFGVRDFRGSIESSGEFRINRRWIWGWDATLLTDRAFLKDYPVSAEGTGSERVSQIYLVGQGERSYFDVGGMHFTGFSRLDRQDELPLIHPVLDYSFVVGRPVLGGELGFRANFTSLSRQEADYDPINSTALAATVCDARAIAVGTNPGNCLMRGIPGDYTRFTSEVNWRRTVINGWGMVFRPFVSARADVASRRVSDDFSGDPATGSSGFIDTGRETLVRAMPAVGMEVRWPFISVHSWGTQVVEPIAQLIVRPNETHVGKFPNEDAQSLVFDDTNLFAIDKYSGYDRVEGGTRANVGVQYTANIHRYGMVNVLFGQSYHLAGRNSFAAGDIANTGLQSGLETDVSDYVARVYFQPTGNLSFVTRFRFDKDNFDIRRFELETRSTWDRLSLATIYARYDAQPLIGYLDRREGIYQTAAFRLHQNWSIFGGVRYDLDRDRIDMGMVGLSYIDECFAAALSYVADYTKLTYTRPVHRIMLRLNLRTLGGTAIATHIGSERTGP